MALGGALGLVVLVGIRRLDFQVFREPIVWALGLVNAIGFDLQNEGIVLTTASKTALLVNVNVVFIAILMVLFFREAVTGSKIAGILIGVLGVVVLATKLDPNSMTGGQFAGDLLVFVAGLVWAFYVAGVRWRVDRGGDYVALAAAILVATAAFAPLPLFVIGWPWPASTAAWLGLVYLGLVPTFAPLLHALASPST